MKFAEFAAKLKKLHPDLRAIAGPWYASGVYIRRPCHEDSDEKTGLLHLTSVPSPRFYTSIPKHSKKHGYGRDGEPGFIRGWKEAVETICYKARLSRAKANLIFGGLR